MSTMDGSIRIVVDDSGPGIDSGLGQGTGSTRRAARGSGLLVSDGIAQVKVETNVEFRGTLLPPAVRPVSAGATELLRAEAPATVVDRAEVFAGKFMAALDRQHPRDLYDVWRLYERGAVEPQMLSAFVVYLCGHNRPAHEVLDSAERLVAEDYERAIVGMIPGEVPTLKTLLASRARLRRDIVQGLTESDRVFLTGFVNCEPVWSLLPYPHASELPALAWKLRDLEVFRAKRPEEFARQNARLAELLA